MTNSPSPTRKYHRWTIGDRLAAARKTITASQSEFAQIIGISVPTISRYETAPDEFRRKTAYMKLWANTTGFDLDWLTTGIEPSDGPDGGGQLVSLSSRKRAREQDNSTSLCTLVSRPRAA